MARNASRPDAPHPTFVARRSVRRRTRPAWKAAAVLAAGTLLAAGCASGGDPSGPAGGASHAHDPDAVYTGWVDGEPSAADPQDGGTLSYATYDFVSTLDPVDRQDGGSTGGSAMAAIYDLLMRYDPEADDYVPQLAESLERNDDGTVWTLRLRDGVTFSDGTPLDADAVVWSTDRYVANGGTHARLWNATVESVEARDARTVVYTLTQPWSEFPSMLATGPGMIVAPSSDDPGGFTPIGAGPFTVSTFTPDTELVLSAREDYWGGPPHLDRLRFPAIVQEQGKVDAVRSDDIQMGYIRNADVVHGAIENGVNGWMYASDLSGVLLINSRAGRAGHDATVRRAIAAGIDPAFFDDRVNGGFGAPGSAMFQDWSRWYQGEDHHGYDPAEARALLDQAKADGYDGVLEYAGMNAPAAKKSALAVQAMLEDVGFTVHLDFASSISDLVKKMYAEHDFDIGYSGFNVIDEVPFVRLYSNLYSTSPSNPMGYTNPRMDELLTKVQTASDDTEKREALGRIQKLVDDDAPFVSMGAGRTLIAMNDTVHGVEPSQDGIMLFGDAWVEQG